MISGSEFTADSSISFSDCGLIEINFVEMGRQCSRIEEVKNDIIGTNNSNISEIKSSMNELASLIDYSLNFDFFGLDNLSSDIDSVVNYMNYQMENFKKQQEWTSEEINQLNNLIDYVLSNKDNSYNQKREELKNNINISNKNEISSSDIVSNEMKKGFESNVYEEGKNSWNNFCLNVLGTDEGVKQEKLEVLKEMYDYFHDQGLSDEVIAGILGHCAYESRFDTEAKNPYSSAKGLFQNLASSYGYPDNWDVKTQCEQFKSILESNPTSWEDKTVDRWTRVATSPTVGEATKRALVEYGIYSYKNINDLYSEWDLSTRQEFSNAIYYYIMNGFQA